MEVGAPVEGEVICPSDPDGLVTAAPMTGADLEGPLCPSCSMPWNWHSWRPPSPLLPLIETGGEIVCPPIEPDEDDEQEGGP